MASMAMGHVGMMPRLFMSSIHDGGEPDAHDAQLLTYGFGRLYVA